MTEETTDPKEPTRDPDAASPPEEQPGDEAASGEGAAGEWIEQLGDGYRRLTTWLSDEIERLDTVGRDKLKTAVDEIQERFPAESRKQLVEKAEGEIQELLGELRQLGKRIRSNPRISEAEKKGASALASSVHKVKEWAEQAEERLARHEPPAATTAPKEAEPDAMAADEETTASPAPAVADTGDHSLPSHEEGTRDEADGSDEGSSSEEEGEERD